MKERGASTVVEFMVLVVLAITVAVGITSWMRTTGEEAREKTEKKIDSKDISFHIENIERTDGRLNVTIVNSGKFNIPNEEITAYYDGKKASVKNFYGPNPLPPGESMIVEVSREN